MWHHGLRYGFISHVAAAKMVMVIAGMYDSITKVLILNFDMRLIIMGLAIVTDNENMM